MIFKIASTFIIVKYLNNYIKENIFLVIIILYSFNKISFLETIISIIVIIILNYCFKDRELLDLEIIKNGKINFENLKKSNLTIEKLIKYLDYINVEDILKCTVNNKGKIKVIKQKYSSPICLIVDGKINYLNLKQIKKDISWLIFLLNKRKLNLDDVYLAFYFNNNIHFIKNNHFN
jgi:uncharacterized membrane protein YcaP (DUF421 family)